MFIKNFNKYIFGLHSKIEKKCLEQTQSGPMSAEESTIIV